MLHGENTGTATKADDGAAASQVFGAMDGIKHFTASAKTGDNIDEIFEYVVQRISARWKWQDEQDMLNGRLSRDGPDNVRTGGKNDSIKVGDPPKAERKGWRAGCC
jgi:Ras-related protein Rab-7A